MKLGKSYDSLYYELLLSFKNLKSKKKYSLLYPIIGEKYSKSKLLICGRSCNGWINTWKINDIDANINTIIKESKNISCNTWSEEEMSKYSSFWRFTKNIITNYYKVNSSDWTQYFTWSNIMKISPATGGNPSDDEFNQQIGICKKILKYEIDILKPKYCILLTGWDWSYDFIESLGFEPIVKPNKIIVKGVYDYKKTRIIVTGRPEYKSSLKFLNSVMKYMS